MLYIILMDMAFGIWASFVYSATTRVNYLYVWLLSFNVDKSLKLPHFQTWPLTSVSSLPIAQTKSLMTSLAAEYFYLSTNRSSAS